MVHPLHLEVAANIKSRDEIMALFFGLAAIMLLVKSMEQRRWMLSLAGTLCFMAACLCKSNAVALLPVVLLVAWYREKEVRINRTLAVCGGIIAVCSLGLVMLIRHLQSTVSDDTALHLNSSVLNNIFLWSAHTETITPRRW